MTSVIMNLTEVAPGCQAQVRLVDATHWVVVIGLFRISNGDIVKSNILISQYLLMCNTKITCCISIARRRLTVTVIQPYLTDTKSEVEQVHQSLSTQQMSVTNQTGLGLAVAIQSTKHQMCVIGTTQHSINGWSVSGIPQTAVYQQSAWLTTWVQTEIFSFSIHTRVIYTAAWCHTVSPPSCKSSSWTLTSQMEGL